MHLSYLVLVVPGATKVLISGSVATSFLLLLYKKALPKEESPLPKSGKFKLFPCYDCSKSTIIKPFMTSVKWLDMFQ